jgi:hypothetical protein
MALRYAQARWTLACLTGVQARAASTAMLIQ